MNQILSVNFTNSFNEVKSYLTVQSKEWAGRFVTSLDSAKTYLDDPRFASLSLLLGNFIIAEIAIRIGDLIGCLFPSDIPETAEQRNIRLAFVIPITGGLIIAGNVAFVKATGIKLNPIVITAVAAITWVMRLQMGNYLFDEKYEL